MASFINNYKFPNFETVHSSADTTEDLPGPRCGHTLTAVEHRLVLFGGITPVRRHDGSVSPAISMHGVTNAVHCFNVRTQKWRRVVPFGEAPSPRVGHAAAESRDQIFIQGGIGPNGACNGDLYILDMTTDKFIWRRMEIPGEVPGPRYGHVMGFVDHWLVVFGGKCENGILADTWVLDTSRPFVWEKLKPIANQPTGRIYAAASSRDDGTLVICGGRDYSGVPLGDAYSLEMHHPNGRWVWTSFPAVATSQRYQHSAVFVDARLHVIGGALIGPHVIDAASAVIVLDTGISGGVGVWLGRCDPGSHHRGQNPSSLMRRCFHAAAYVASRIYIYGGVGGPEKSGVLLGDFLVSEDDIVEPSSILVDRLPTVDAAFYVDATEGTSRFQHRNVMVAHEIVETRARVIIIDRFENERRRTNDSIIYNTMPKLTGEKFIQYLVDKIISMLLKPNSWEPPANRTFFLNYPKIEELCHAVIQTCIHEPTVLQLNLPTKVFGDLHGHFAELMKMFSAYGEPSEKGDIASNNYVFLGDYVDRGKHSLETIILLFALKVKYPEKVHLVRGNHESAPMNAAYGFKMECEKRMEYGLQAWRKINLVFDYLALAAVIDGKIFCVHGGIGASTHSIEDVSSIQKPILIDCPDESLVTKEVLWSDPTDDESITGLQKNSRGPGIVCFGPDIVEAFCQRNNLDMIIRAHQCVMKGFRTFAQGRLMTVFSVANYCGNFNAGAILVIGEDKTISPLLIKPRSTPEQKREEMSSSVGEGSNPGSEGGSASPESS